jgi:uncharacterized phiE125 gp8 family phage protein
MGYKVITPAVLVDIMPLAKLQVQCKVDVSGGGTSAQDDRIWDAFAAAIGYAEHYTQRSVGVQTLELALDSFPSDPPGIELELGAGSITSIKYVDVALVEQTIASNQYALDDYSFKHWAIPVDAWPTPAAVANAVKVRYVTPAAVPATVKQALLLLTAHFFENQQAVLVGNSITAVEVPLGADALLNTVRHYSM